MRISHVFAIGILFCLVFGLSCKRPVAPEVKGVSEFKINRDNPDRKMRLQMAVEVFNPNKYQIKLKSYDLNVFLNGKEAGRTSGKKTQVMKGNATTLLRFALESDFKKILGGIAGLAGGFFSGKKGVDFRVVGEIRARAIGIGKTIPIDFTNFVKWSELGL